MTILHIGNSVPKLQSAKICELFRYDRIRGSNIDMWTSDLKVLIKMFNRVHLKHIYKYVESFD